MTKRKSPLVGVKEVLDLAQFDTLHRELLLEVAAILLKHQETNNAKAKPES